MKNLAVATTLMLLILVVPLQSRAGVMIGDQIKFYDNVGFPGGIFNIDVLNNPVAPNFKTFCVELTENVDFTTTYVVDNIGTTSVLGGKSLTPYTAWLYDRFLHGTLASFNAASEIDVNTLQLAIWESIGYDQTDVSTHVGPNWYNGYNAVLQNKPWSTNYTYDVTHALWSGLGDVRIMNLKTLAGVNAQDQLTTVPEPFSIAVWSLAIVCVGAVWKLKEAARLSGPARSN